MRAIMLLTMPLGFVFLLTTAMLRGVGDTLTPLMALALSTAIGLILTPLLIRGWFGLPATGVTAPAWASAISNALTLFVLGLYLRHKKSPLAPDAEFLRSAAAGWRAAREQILRHRHPERGRDGGDGDRRTGAARPRQRLRL